MATQPQFISGVVEGFYGQPWAQDERFELFDWMHRWGLNTYLYAPKDDLKHRTLWRELYSAPEADELRALIGRSREKNLKFIYALAPGLDIQFSKEGETQTIFRRFTQLRELGCDDFALLFDDLPAVMSAEDAKRFRSVASAQAHVTNAVFRWLRAGAPHAQFLFCPTAYCGRMAARGLGGPDYLAAIGRDLLPGIQVLWTGPEIIARAIEAEDLPERLFRRKPVIWDNLHANDYDRSRFHTGPYSGRESIRSRVEGILANPNNEFPLNYVPLRTLALFLEAREGWDPRNAFLQALAEWHSRFETVTHKITTEQLRSFADCYYLPHERGDEARALLAAARAFVTAQDLAAAEELRPRIATLRNFCQRATELQDRRLFHAISRHVWDLREELELLERYIAHRTDPAAAGEEFRSDFHLPQTYRGGIVRELQGLLQQDPSGAFRASPLPL